MASDFSTTIAALATPPSPAGVAVIRVSGEKASETVAALFKGKSSPLTHPRQLTYGKIIDPTTKHTIDKALVVYMPGPKSFTGEDIAEFQVHGGVLIAQKVLKALFTIGISAAEPGEFTKRAFLNGKMDLLQAESVADLITATSSAALQAAQNQLAGKLSIFIDKIAEPIRDVLAEIEARLDFPEEDIEPSTVKRILQDIQHAQKELIELSRSYQYGQKIREGYKVLLCGPPNAGKSSLLNLLLGRERAIVTDISGTTRDLIEEECLIDVHRFVLCDSAGLRKASDTVEQLGIELSISRLPWADLVLVVWDKTKNTSSLKETLSLIEGKANNIWLILNKADLVDNEEVLTHTEAFKRVFSISTRTKSGFSELQEALKDELKSSEQDFGNTSAILTHARQHEKVRQAIESLQATSTVINNKQPLELVSEELRTALRALEEMVGKTYTDDILGRIFSKFCIGK